MSKRAEQRALEAYPVNMQYSTVYDCVYDLAQIERKKFIKAYEQAENDTALTIQDLELIHTFLYAVKNNKEGVFTFTRLSDEQYEEVLRRFNNVKEGEK